MKVLFLVLDAVSPRDIFNTNHKNWKRIPKIITKWPHGDLQSEMMTISSWNAFLTGNNRTDNNESVPWSHEHFVGKKPWELTKGKSLIFGVPTIGPFVEDINGVIAGGALFGDPMDIVRPDSLAKKFKENKYFYMDILESMNVDRIDEILESVKGCRKLLKEILDKNDFELSIISFTHTDATMHMRAQHKWHRVVSRKRLNKLCDDVVKGVDKTAEWIINNVDYDHLILCSDHGGNYEVDVESMTHDTHEKIGFWAVKSKEKLFDKENVDCFDIYKAISHLMKWRTNE